MDTRHEYDQLAGRYLPVAVAVYALVLLAIVWVVLRGRRRTAPSLRKNNVPVELAYVGVLAAIAAVLLVLTYGTEGRIDEPQARPVERIQVLAARWHWRFTYPRHGIVEEGSEARPVRVPTLVVPIGEPVAFEARSQDVIHGIWITSMRFQRELFNDRVNRFTLTFRGDTDGNVEPCSFYCGLLHERMRFRVRALPPREFQAWVRDHERSAT